LRLKRDKAAGSREFIQKAHKKGFKLALTTSALQENQQRIFEIFNLSPYFSTIISGCRTLAMARTTFRRELQSAENNRI
jgi:phosphoglycolate phosphatase-like HAD superfamily hydrolase